MSGYKYDSEYNRGLFSNEIQEIFKDFLIEFSTPGSLKESIHELTINQTSVIYKSDFIYNLLQYEKLNYCLNNNNFSFIV